MKKVYFLLLAIILNSNAFAAGEFVTRWNVAPTNNKITLGVETTGLVSYFWQEISPGSATGSGTFSGPSAVIGGLPMGAVVDVSITPTNFKRIFLSGSPDKARLVDIKQWGTTEWNNMADAFRDCRSLQISATDIPDLRAVNDMSGMFAVCSALVGPPNIGSWNTENVTNMADMFNFAVAFNQPVGTWNTAKVTDMHNMFYHDVAFNQPLAGWNTGNVTDMSLMFPYSAFNQPIGNWNTSKVTDMSGMFFKVTDFNKPINNWNTSSVTDMSTMFQYAFDFNQPLDKWNVSKVTDMTNMLASATKFNQSLGGWTLNAAVKLTGILGNAMDCSNYSATLLGWGNKGATPVGLSLNASGKTYGTEAVLARNNLTTSKGWTITGDAPSGSNCLALPVRLVSFNGKVKGSAVSLEWQTTDEQNNAGFEIEKSTDAIKFEKIGFVDGNGDSKQTRNYHFADLDLLPVNYYRLKQIDFDGTSEYSRIISVKEEDLAFSIYPNPAQNRLYLKNMEGNAEVSISTLDGKVLLKKVVNTTEPIELNRISSGLYLFKIGNENRKLVIDR